MSYQQDLAKLHKERKARFYPIDGELVKAKAELEDIRRHIREAQSELDRLSELRLEIAGHPSLRNLIVAVCTVYGISRDELSSELRTRAYVRARKHLCYIARRDFGASLHQLGRILNRDHTTIIHYSRSAGKNPGTFKDETAALDAFLYGKDAEPMVG